MVVSQEADRLFLGRDWMHMHGKLDALKTRLLSGASQKLSLICKYYIYTRYPE